MLVVEVAVHTNVEPRIAVGQVDALADIGGAGGALVVHVVVHDVTDGVGVVQVGLSLKSHDPSQRANGFLTLAGGIIITFAKEILNLIVGG